MSADLKVLVLNGGFATRLRPWSDVHAKLMLPTCRGNPFRQLACLLAARDAELHVASRIPPNSTLNDVESALQRDHAGAHLHVIDQDSWENTFAIARALNKSATLVLINGDLILDPGWFEVLDDHLRSGSAVTITGQIPYPGRTRGHPFHIDAAGRYTTRAGQVVEAIGMSVLSPGALLTVATNTAVGVNPWFDVILPALSQRQVVRATLRDLPWFDVGSWLGLLAYERSVHATQPGSSCVLGEVGQGASVTDSVVMAGARVESGARLEQTVVLPGAVIPGGRMTESVVVAATGVRSIVDTAMVAVA